MTWLGRIVAVTALGLMAAACRPGAEATLTRGTPDPTVPTLPPVTRPPGVPVDVGKAACSVLSPDEVAAILGNPVRPGAGDGKFCLWGTAVDRGTSANLTIDRPEQCDVRRNALPKEAKTESVGGLGSAAVWNWQQVAILLQGNFVVCWPDSVVWVAVSGEKDQAALRNDAAALAQRAHAKL